MWITSKTPMLVVHGELDYRVPYTQGLQLYTALQNEGRGFQIIILIPTRTIFVSKPKNARLVVAKMCMGWLAKIFEIIGKKLQPTITEEKTRNCKV